MFVYILDTYSRPIEEECHQDCKIKRAKVRKCQDINFPTRLRICVMIQPLITQLQAVFPQNSCVPLCTGCPLLLGREAIQYFVSSLWFLVTWFRPCSRGRIADGHMVFISLLVFTTAKARRCLVGTLCSDPVSSWMLCCPHL